MRHRREDQAICDDPAVQTPLDKETERCPPREPAEIFDLDVHSRRVSGEAERDLLAARRGFDSFTKRGPDRRYARSDWLARVNVQSRARCGERERLSAAAHVDADSVGGAHQIAWSAQHGQRHAVRQRLADAGKVSANSRQLLRAAARDAKAGHHLVENEERPRTVCEQRIWK